MVDWQKSRGHLILLKEFRKPRNFDDLPSQVDWKLMLGEEPKIAVQRFLDLGFLVSANLNAHISCKFKVREIKDMLSKYDLPLSGRNKQELIRRLIQAKPEEMKQAVKDFTVLKCSEKGAKIVEDFLVTGNNSFLRDDSFHADREEKVSKNFSKKISESKVSSDIHEPPKELSETAVYSETSFVELPKSFNSPCEYDSEYILIPGGHYSYQDKTEEEVSSIYFAKYPVTNKCYSRFICYLEGKELELLKILPKGEFEKRMIECASGVNGFIKYLGNEPDDWSVRLQPLMPCRKKRSTIDNHPVAYISWFAARAYCCWLSAIGAADKNSVLNQIRGPYRLPTEIEWEWAASSGSREYPWLPKNGTPIDELANHGRKIWGTTLVGRYPEGATPEGLMDMAGNVWEWMDNWYDKYEETRSVRGGSWSNLRDYMRCSYRSRLSPFYRLGDVGFRVVRSLS
jgi:formylglycine-generating enzyme required for sulfatase activity